MHRCLCVLIAAFVSLFSTVQLSSQSSYNFRTLVRTGDLSPVPHRLSDILEFSFNDKGQVAYVGDGGLFFRSGQRVGVLAGFGEPAPGGGKFAYADTVGLNSAGQIVFRGEVTSPSKSGLFLHFQGKISELIADGTAATNGVLVTATSPVINAAGDVAFLDGTTGGLYLFSKGIISPIAIPGASAPGGGTFTFFSQQSINQSDQVVFVGYLSSGGSGVYLASVGTISKIIASGDTFPDGGVFSFAEGPSINDAGQIAFGGISNGSTNDGGLFFLSSGNLKVVVPILTVLPNGSYLSSAFAASLNNAGQIAFTAFTEPNGTGTFLFSGGTVTQVSVTGETSPDGDIFGLGGELGAQINSTGQILLLSSMTYHNDTLYLFSAGQLTRVAGQGDTVNHEPQFEFPSVLAIGNKDTVLLSDSTFPGGVGYYMESPSRTGLNMALVADIGTTLGAGVINYAPVTCMNHVGQVAMTVGTLDAYAEVLLSSGNSLTVIAGGPNSQFNPTLNPGQLAINNLGEVAFFGYEGSQSGLFLNSNGLTNLLLSASTAAPGGGTLGYMWSVSLNNQDQAAFFAQPTAPSQSGMFSYLHGTLTALALNGSAAPGGGSFFLPYWNSRFGPVSNDTGSIAFGTYIDSYSGSGVFLYSNNTLTRIVGPGDPAPGGGSFLSADSPSINASGEVAFFGQTTNNLGVFLYSNGQITQVAASGDLIGTESLGYIDQPQLNDNGNIAFTSNLSNGVTAAFVATRKSARGPAGKSTDLAVTHPIAPNSPIIQKLKLSYQRAVEYRQKKSRRPIALEMAPNIATPR